MKTRYIFLRDDDVYRPDKKFRRVFEFCLKQKLPVNYAAIPARLKPELADYFKKQDGGLFNVIQHGWKHADHSASPPRYEFGPGRSLNLQKQDISAGRSRMSVFFRKTFTPAFVPPYHYYDQNTLAACAELGLGIFSAGTPRFPMEKTGLVYLPAEISVNKYDDAFNPMPLSFENLRDETAAYLQSHRCAGIFFHHDAFTDADFTVFKKYLLFVKSLAEKGKTKFLLFSELLR